jgi:nucleotide-binding universal stress UspA family protein
MKAFSHILFPVDFSPRCEATIPFVREMVERCQAKLTLLHVVEIPVNWYAAVTPSLHMPWDEFESQFKLGRECLSSFGCRYFGAMPNQGIETICERGDPGYAILAQAENTGCDLIMMPTHGTAPIRSLFLGSVTARVLHHSECAIWTDSHVETGLSSDFLHIRKILCAVNRQEHSVELTREALALAETYGAEVELVHAIETVDAGAVVDLGATAGDEMAALQEKVGARLKTHLGAGSVREVIRNAAREITADLVMIGRGHIRKPFSRLRSHAYSIIQDSPCPVLSC